MDFLQPTLETNIPDYLDKNEKLPTFSRRPIKTSKNQKVIIYYQSVNLDELEAKHWKQKVIKLIGQEYTSAHLTLQWISNKVGRNTKCISQFIKEEFNLSFKQYLNKIRLFEAKRLLKSEALSLKEIAHMVGYGSSNHFTRVFRKYEKQTPSEYRQSN